jgi:hypothetical protein
MTHLFLGNVINPSQEFEIDTRMRKDEGEPQNHLYLNQMKEASMSLKPESVFPKSKYVKSDFLPNCNHKHRKVDRDLSQTMLLTGLVWD